MVTRFLKVATKKKLPLVTTAVATSLLPILYKIYPIPRQTWIVWQLFRGKPEQRIKSVLKSNLATCRHIWDMNFNSKHWKLVVSFIY